MVFSCGKDGNLTHPILLKHLYDLTKIAQGHHKYGEFHIFLVYLLYKTVVKNIGMLSNGLNLNFL